MEPISNSLSPSGERAVFERPLINLMSQSLQIFSGWIASLAPCMSATRSNPIICSVGGRSKFSIGKVLIPKVAT